MRDPSLFLARLWAVDEELVRAGWPEMSPWWKRQIERFVRSGRRRFVLRVGRRGGKSSTLCRLAVAWALFGTWYVPPGDVAVIPFVSIDRTEASGRLRTISEILTVLGVEFSTKGETIQVRSKNVAFRVVTCSVSGTVGFTAIAAFGDEMARWESRETSANPAREVMGSLRPTMATQPEAFEIDSSSPWGTDDYHHELFAAGDDGHQCVAAAATWEANPTITEAETHALEPDDRTREREYGAIPQEGIASNWFADAVDKSLTDSEPPPIGLGQRPIISIDPAFSHDFFGYSVICSEPSDTKDPVTGRVYRRTWVNRAGSWRPSEFGGSPKAALERLRDEIAVPVWRASGQDGMPRVFTDQYEFNSLSERGRDVGLVLEEVGWHGGDNETSKRSRFRRVRTAMRDGSFLIKRGNPVIAEMRRVKGVLMPSGNERIEYARTGEGHCDTLSAVVLGGSVALERVPKAVEPIPPVLNEGQRLRAEAIKAAQERQKKQWERDPRVVMRAALRR